jgi:hypothetical protein
VFLLDEEEFVEVKGHHEGFLYEGVYQPETDGPLELYFHVDEGDDGVHVVPDEGDDVGDEDEALKQCFYGES